MASSISTFKTTNHARSISLPSRSHPISATAEQSLCMRPSEATTSSPSLISHNLSVLSGLCERMNDVLQLPLTQQTLCHKQHARYLEEEKQKQPVFQCFESLLLVVSGTKSESKSLVSKLIRSKRVACEGEDSHTSEVEKIECALDALKQQKSSKSDDFERVQNLQKQLESFESRIQELNEGVESLFRHIMRIRVSLLNILNY
ncbi:Protein BPS1, chloroplastic [Dillenia turbinata]|uniref:Protein BPS1, chloroplastic n=1 Tax=Dillenia turbinata TaxID=194707 RepID=A0AAN8ZIS4_9MAGN